MSISVDEVIAALKNHKNVLLYGPPGTGKSHLMNEVAQKFSTASGGNGSSNVVSVDTDSENNPLTVQKNNTSVQWVTFHQGYSYEDFVIGLKPQAGPNGQFSLIPKPGVLIELSAAAIDGTGLLIIDEINRGNASRIFGEFITLMEPDKRLAKDGSKTTTTVEITLPYLSKEEVINIQTLSGTQAITRKFAMPSEVYTLASMNSVDKSIAPIDTALRRRFHIINLFPSQADIEKSLKLETGASDNLKAMNSLISGPDVAALAAAVMRKLNRSIGLHLGPEYMLGQWYFNNFPEDFEGAKNTLYEIWLYRILPQLIELFLGRTDILITLLENGYSYGLTKIEPTLTEVEDGALSYLWTSSPPPSIDEIILFLQKFAGAPEVKALL